MAPFTLTRSRRVYLTFASIWVLNVIAWPLSCSPDILRSLLMKNNNVALVSAVDSSGQEGDDARYLELTWLMAVGMSSFLICNFLVLLLQREFNSAIIGGIGTALSAFATFMFFNGQSHQEVLWAAVGGGAAGNLIGIGSTYVVRMLPFTYWERGYVALGLVPDIGLVIPILFDILTRTIDSESVSRVASTWAFFIILAAFGVAFMIPNEFKLKQYKTSKHMDRGIEVTDFDYWEVCGDYLTRRERIARGVSVSEYTYDYESEPSDDHVRATEQSFQTPYGTPSNVPIGLGSTGSSYQWLRNKLSIGLGSANPATIVSYTGFDFHQRDWRVQARSLPFIVSGITTAVGQTSRVYILLHLRTMLLENAYVNKLLTGAKKEPLYYFGSQVLTPQVVDRMMMYFNYAMPLCFVFSIVTSRAAYISIQVLLWFCLVLWIICLFLLSFSSPITKLLSGIIFVLLSSYNFSLFKQFSREFLNNLYFWPEIFAGVSMLGFFYYEKIIWQYLNLEHFDFEKRKELIESIAKGSATFDELTTPDKLSTYMPYHSYTLYVALFNVLILLSLPLTRLYYDRKEYYKMFNQKQTNDEPAQYRSPGV